MRLEKYIATSGVASRRAVKRAILAGRVTVNGARVLIPGHPINVATDRVEFDSKKVEPVKQRFYVMLHKPAGYLTTRRDERNRPTVMELVRDISESIYPVGRLDLETEGLLLLTNDGTFAYRLTHPSHEIPKTYLAWVDGIPNDAAVERLRKGVAIPSGKTAPAKIRCISEKDFDEPWKKTAMPNRANRMSRRRKPVLPVTRFKLVIHEGKKRQVRLMFKAVGHTVTRLKRIQVGEVRLGNLPPGQYRFLTPAEIANLYA